MSCAAGLPQRCARSAVRHAGRPLEQAVRQLPAVRAVQNVRPVLCRTVQTYEDTLPAQPHAHTLPHAGMLSKAHTTALRAVADAAWVPAVLSPSAYRYLPSPEQREAFARRAAEDFLQRVSPPPQGARRAGIVSSCAPAAWAADCHGIVMGLSWDCHGIVMGLSWDCQQLRTCCGRRASDEQRPGRQPCVHACPAAQWALPHSRPRARPLPALDPR
jgi:hypothetical protein